MIGLSQELLRAIESRMPHQEGDETLPADEQREECILPYVRQVFEDELCKHGFMVVGSSFDIQGPNDVSVTVDTGYTTPQREESSCEAHALMVEMVTWNILGDQAREHTLNLQTGLSIVKASSRDGELDVSVPDARKMLVMDISYAYQSDVPPNLQDSFWQVIERCALRLHAGLIFTKTYSPAERRYLFDMGYGWYYVGRTDVEYCIAKLLGDQPQ